MGWKGKSLHPQDDLPLRSTRREFERRKSAHNRGRETSAIVKVHWYLLEAK